MLRKTDFNLDMQKGDHRALVLRAFFDLLAEGEEPDAARQRAPMLAIKRWKNGEDFPGFYPRRWSR